MTSILYKDKSVIVCLKRPGELSQLGKPGERSLPVILAQEHGGEIFPVHRLDREAGGIMVYARTKAAAASLSAAIQNRALKKEYVCVVRGVPAQQEGTYHDLLLHDKQRNKTFVVQRMRGGVKEAVLHYRVLAQTQENSMVRVSLQTGRTHQIRVQFSSRKNPLLGDGKYGGGSGELALWSCHLAFPHPDTKKMMSFEQMPSGGVWTAFGLV